MLHQGQAAFNTTLMELTGIRPGRMALAGEHRDFENEKKIYVSS